MKLSPYIVVNYVQESIDFYKSTFGGEVIPLNEHEGKLLHAELKIQEDVVFIYQMIMEKAPLTLGRKFY